MRNHPNNYIIDNNTVAELSLVHFSKHCTELYDTAKSDFFEIVPESIEVNFGLFTHPSLLIDFPVVSVSQINQSILLTCPCDTSKAKMCEHQAQVLYNIIDRPYLRIFFDSTLRLSKIKKFAREFGMEDENNLEDYFEVEYTSKAYVIKPRIKELIKINDSSNEMLRQQLLPEKAFVPVPISSDKTIKKVILIIRRHKFYDQLQIELYEGEVTKNGKIKNPLVEVDPLSLMLNTERVEEAKFLSAVSKFQNIYSSTTFESSIEWLKILVSNPLKFEVYYHDKELSEKVTAASVVAIQLNTFEPDIQLHVFKKEPFYEVSGEVNINNKTLDFKNLSIKYRYFIHRGNTFSLIADIHLLRIIEFFKANNQKVIIHSSKYNEFSQNILEKLEHRININYSFIKPATKAQLTEQEFDLPIEKIIYLSDHENYVSITPVMKYGNVEIPVFSRKQLFNTDQNGNIFKVERDNAAEIHFTSIIMRQHPDFEEQLQETEYFYLHKDRFLDENWFLDVFEEWRRLKIIVLGFNDLKKNKLNANKAIISVKVISGIDWFNTSLIVKFGKQKAKLKQIHKAIRNKSKFVQLDDGTLGILPNEWMNKMVGFFQTGQISDDLLQIPKSNFNEIEKLFDQSMLDPEVKAELSEYSKRFSNFEGIKEIPVPKELKASLRDYQHQGLNWLNFLDDFNFGACLADDMGLGKTIQIIAFILLQRKKRKQNTNLVVVPTSLLFNWQAEVAKFAPSIKMLIHYGPNREKSIKAFQSYEIVLSTYGMILSDIRSLKDFEFNYIFLDESQAIKNPDSQRYKAACLLHSRNRVVLTGTPIENNTFDIYGQLSFACPGLLGSKKYFKDIYSIPIDNFGNSRRAIELQKKIEPFILRRTKKQVAKELPEKTEMVIYCEMGDAQRKVYEQYETELRDYLSSKNDENLAKDSMHVLTGLTKLRQICNSPVLLKDEDHLGGFSTKIETLMEQIENKSSQHKILVFSQFVSMLDLIKKELQKKNITFEYLTGQTKNRAAAVNEFQDNDEVRVFLISLKAGGTGLNLTEADYVYLVDPWWNPAAENQAIDRCYRIGQKKHVIAVRLICPNTIEEKIMKLQQSKIKLVNDLIKTDASFVKSFSKNELLSMLGD